MSTSQMTLTCNRSDQQVRCPPPAVHMDGELNMLPEAAFESIRAYNLIIHRMEQSDGNVGIMRSN